MATVSESFNYDECLDLIRLMPADSTFTSDDFWPIILAVFSEKANKKSFYYGKRVGPTLSDVELILRKLE